MADLRLSEDESRVLDAARHVVAASGVPSVHAIAVAAGLRDDQAQTVAEELSERGLLREDLTRDAGQDAEWLATRRYVLTDAGAAALDSVG